MAKAKKRRPSDRRPHKRNLLGYEECYDETGVAAETWRKYVRLGLITSIRIGRLRKIPREALNDFLAKRTVAAQ
jgi:excisionase family DNA binding protein